tara:strand:- start:1023 stop:1331 length:309 start_codon:yes stop_codon:yes gene_type:complete
MKAIIKNGCQQFKVTEGDYIKIMPIQSPEGASISFDKVIMAFDENNAMLPTSKTSSIKVTGVVKKHGRYKKIRVVKFKRRKHYMRSHGHKQNYTEIKIESIK